MSEIIKSAVNNSRKIVSENKKSDSISDDRAFSYTMLEYFFNVQAFQDQDDLVTDGSNDGGIDFLFYDDDENKLHVCQSKYTSALSYEDIVKELNKMNSTIVNFRIGNTGSYNERLKSALQNAMDRLPDEEADNITYDLFTTAPINVEEALTHIAKSSPKYSVDSVSLYSEEDVEKRIQDVQEKIQTVDYYKLRIDKSNNYLEYESDNAKGAMINLQSQSLIALYNAYSNRGLFDLNIRRYIANKTVDSGIKRTLDKERDDFWFLNNGIIIACEDFSISGDYVTVSGFSIVNGGQTTTLIGKYNGKNTQNFCIPCKLISEKDNGKKKDSTEFFTKIAEATNSQKPILPRDLKSNAPEMLRLAKWLLDEKIYLEIKRGVKCRIKPEHSIKNDELAQLILSMVYQRPGTSRSNKRKIFEIPDLYNRVFRANYDKDPNKKAFIIDLIRFYDRYKAVEELLKADGLNELQTEVLKNGTQIIFALIGVVYMITNNDLQIKELISDLTIIKTRDFVYGSFISNYTGDDIDKKLRRLVIDIVKIATEAYDNAFKSKQTTSVSNFFKTDSKYLEAVLHHFVDCHDMTVGEDLFAQADILKRV